jgi:putative phosphoesterase
MIRVAILADTHGQVDGRVIEVVAGCDLAVHGGDVGGAWILRSLQPRGGRVIAVAGNNDVPRKWPKSERDLLAHLPEVAELALPGGTLTLIHGHQTPARGRHARLRARYPGTRLVVYGHSHRLVADLDAEPWVINPGAAGRERTFGGPSCIVLTAAESAWTLELCRFEPVPRRSPARPWPLANKAAT